MEPNQSQIAEAHESNQIELKSINYIFLRELGPGFWNIRAKLFVGPLNIGTVRSC